MHPKNRKRITKHKHISVSVESDDIAAVIIENLYYLQGTPPETATRKEWYLALAYTVRDRMWDRFIKLLQALKDSKDPKLVAYLSAEYLTGPQLGNALINLGIWNAVQEAASSLGLDLGDLLEEEDEPGLGNGGLGRLAACFMDSMATLDIPAIGYGIRYEFGIFSQELRDGWQVERTDKWLLHGNPWELPRPHATFEVKWGGETEHFRDKEGRYTVRWVPEMVVKGIAYDTPVPGYRAPTTCLLRLWKAEAVESFDFEKFNTGDYYAAVHKKIISETVSKVLYPNDQPEVGKQLRLGQQYFFVSCSLQDMIKIHLAREKKLEEFHLYWAAQLNDTHPSIAVAELMRLLVDEHMMDWEQAWEVTRKTFSYTNHTLLPEALEKWPVSLFGKLLPRHLEIIYEINRRFLDELRASFPDDDGFLRRMSLIDETGERYVRMAHLACAGSHAINGVSALHTELLKETVLRDFYETQPEKFFSITNGVTPRRWLLLSNPKLSALITANIGEQWISDLEGEIIRIEPLAGDAGFRQEWQSIKSENKRALAEFIKESTGILVDSQSLFDVHVKRVHEYKRQLLNVLHIITLYNQIRHGSVTGGVTPRTVIFGGKAAPGYFMAKLILKLINSVASVVNNDPAASELLKVVFIPNFNVKNGQRIYPAADLSEQISTAGTEASGTGNMKFTMNGALTIGTQDGANIELRDAVGSENFFSFGLTVHEIAKINAQGYNPRAIYETNAELREVMDLLGSGFFSKGDSELFRPIVESLLSWDNYMVLADYKAYIDCQKRVSETYESKEDWTRISILNTARAGRFSSDRAIREYCRNVWNVRPSNRGLS